MGRVVTTGPPRPGGRRKMIAPEREMELAYWLRDGLYADRDHKELVQEMQRLFGVSQKWAERHIAEASAIVAETKRRETSPPEKLPPARHLLFAEARLKRGDAGKAVIHAFDVELGVGATVARAAIAEARYWMKRGKPVTETGREALRKAEESLRNSKFAIAWHRFGPRFPRR